MAIYYKDDNMSVQNPLGVLNLNPLPDGLPSGLVRAHLTRRSLNASRINLVTTELTDLEEHSDTQSGEISYKDRSIKSSHLWNGWRDETYAVDYGVGFTWLAVGKYPQQNPIAVYSSVVNFSSSVGEELSWRSGGIRFGLRRDGGGVSAVVQLPSIPDGHFMGFGALDRDDSEFCAYVPHTDQIEMDAEPSDGASPPATPGLLLCRGGTGFANLDANTDAEMAFFAAWDRPLSQSEMQEAYQLLKPWLARRGVSIA